MVNAHQHRADRSDEPFVHPADRHGGVLARPCVGVELRPHARRFVARLRDGGAGDEPSDQPEASRVGRAIGTIAGARAGIHTSVCSEGNAKAAGITPAMVSPASATVSGASTILGSGAPDCSAQPPLDQDTCGLERLRETQRLEEPIVDERDRRHARIARAVHRQVVSVAWADTDSSDGSPSRHSGP